MATGSRRKYNLAVEEAQEQYMAKSYEKMDMLKRKHIAEATQLFVMAQRELYGINPDWNSMTLEQKTPHGWIRPQFILTETMTNGRWKFWIDFRAACQFGSGKAYIEYRDIPQIKFLSTGQSNNIAKEMLNVCLGDAPGACSYSKYEMLELFVDWLLYGFGSSEVKELPSKITSDMNGFWYKEFKPQLLMIFPDDYLGEIAADNKVARGSSYFPTPMNIVDVMTRMSMEHGEATKYQKVNDPCLGSGRMLLHASNYSLRLYGQDINKFIHKVSLVNAYLYMPWAVESDDLTNKVLDEMAEIHSK